MLCKVHFRITQKGVLVWIILLWFDFFFKDLEKDRRKLPSAGLLPGLEQAVRSELGTASWSSRPCGWQGPKYVGSLPSAACPGTLAIRQIRSRVEQAAT